MIIHIYSSSIDTDTHKKQ